MRDRDNKTLLAWGGWTGAGDGTLEERTYYSHNWRGDVSVLLTDTGKMLEWVHYTPYGTPRSMPAGDTDSDGDWDNSDNDYLVGDSPSYDVRADADLDGDVDGDDATHANSIAGGYQTLGYAVLSSTGVLNRKALAAYETDTASPELRHVRYRVMNTKLGRWVRRDPVGYVDGYNLYAYVPDSLVGASDAIGLLACQAGESGNGFSYGTARGCADWEKKNPPTKWTVPQNKPASWPSDLDFLKIKCKAYKYPPGMSVNACTCWEVRRWKRDYVLARFVIARYAAEAFRFQAIFPDQCKNNARHCYYSCCLHTSWIDQDAIDDILYGHECCRFILTALIGRIYAETWRAMSSVLHALGRVWVVMTVARRNSWNNDACPRMLERRIQYPAACKPSQSASARGV